MRYTLKGLKADLGDAKKSQRAAAAGVKVAQKAITTQMKAIDKASNAIKKLVA